MYATNVLRMIGRIIVGFLVAALGFSMVWKTEFFMSILGEVDFAIKYLGGGGTRLFYKLMGTAIIIIGFMIITNMWEDFMVGLVSRVF